MPHTAGAATFSVNSTNDLDDGACNVAHCSLREAINAGNVTSAADLIEFGSLSAGDQWIALVTELPEISQSLTIDGRTHPDGAVAVCGAGLATTEIIVVVGGTTEFFALSTDCPTGARVLTVTKEGSGSGVITSSPAGIDCGVDCSEAYGSGQVVTLTATPDADSTFAGWSGAADCADGTVTLMADRTCTASFEPTQKTLAVSKIGTGSGTVTSSPAGINCGADCSEVYDSGQVVTLTATPDAGSTFAGWSGAADCVDGMVSLTADTSCTADFSGAAGPPNVTISIPADNSMFGENTPILFSGLASDLEDGDLTAGLVWTSSREGALGTGGAVSAELSKKGKHKITASVTDSDGQTATGSISVKIVRNQTTLNNRIWNAERNFEAVSISSESSEVQAGAEVTFQAGKVSLGDGFVVRSDGSFTVVIHETLEP